MFFWVLVGAEVLLTVSLICSAMSNMISNILRGFLALWCIWTSV